MGKYLMLRRAALKKQKGSVTGIFLLMAMISLCLFTSVTLYFSGEEAVRNEMDRLGFGDFTAWVSGQPENLEEELRAVPGVGDVRVQPLIYAGMRLTAAIPIMKAS